MTETEIRVQELMNEMNAKSEARKAAGGER